MRKDQPRSFRLTGEEVAALEWLSAKTGESRSRAVGRLVLEAVARVKAEDQTERLDAIEARLRALESEEAE